MIFFELFFYVFTNRQTARKSVTQDSKLPVDKKQNRRKCVIENTWNTTNCDHVGFSPANVLSA